MAVKEVNGGNTREGSLSVWLIKTQAIQEEGITLAVIIMLSDDQGDEPVQEEQQQQQQQD